MRYSKKATGVLKGFNFSLNTDVYLVYTFGPDKEEKDEFPSSGAIAWYVHDASSCDQCHPGGECHEVLNQVINERGMTIPPEIEESNTGKKAEWVLRILNEERCKETESK